MHQQTDPVGRDGLGRGSGECEREKYGSSKSMAIESRCVCGYYGAILVVWERLLMEEESEAQKHWIAKSGRCAEGRLEMVKTLDAGWRSQSQSDRVSRGDRKVTRQSLGRRHSSRRVPSPCARFRYQRAEQVIDQALSEAPHGKGFYPFFIDTDRHCPLSFYLFPRAP